MRSSSDTITLRDYLRVLSTRRWTVVSVTVIAVGIGAAYAVLRHPTYNAVASIQFQTKYISVFTPGVQLPPDITPSQTAAADSRIVTRPEVVAAVKKSLSSRLSIQELRQNVSTTVEPDSNLIDITASARRARLSEQIANAFASQTRIFAATNDRGLFASEAAELRKALSGASGITPSTAKAYRSAIARLTVLSQVADPVAIIRPATVPRQPAAPRPVRDTTLAAVLGVIVGIGLAFLRNALDQRIRDPREVEQALGSPLVGYVPATTSSLVIGGENGSSALRSEQLEPFRVLHTNVTYLAGRRRVQSVVVTGPAENGDRITVARWYAYVCAADGQHTVLVDCDLRAARLADSFGVSSSPGLTDHLAGNATLDDIRRSMDVAGSDEECALTLIPAGSNGSATAEPIVSGRLKEFVKQLLNEYEVVVFDAAPLPANETLQIVPLADAVLLCVRLGKTMLPRAQAARDSLNRLPAKPIGIVVTGVRSDRSEFEPHSTTSESVRGAGTR